jgi:hypothetical protein
MPLREFEIKDFGAMSSNIGNPSANTGEIIKNLDIHEKPGVLTLRPGYDLKYDAPTLPDHCDNLGFLTFHNFYDTQADPKGKECTLLLQKIRINSSITGDDTEYKQVAIHLIPYWNGTRWVNDWQWLNAIRITKITTGSDATYQNMVYVSGDHSDTTQWILYNKTKDVYSQIITATLDSGNTRIIHTLYTSDYDVDDVIVLIKNYVPLTQMQENYNTLWRNIDFHKVNNDIIVGFEGKENRLGIKIGFRNKYFQATEFNYSNVHSDLTDKIEDFTTINDVILDPYTIYDNDAYGLDLTPTGSGSLSAGTYYFRLTAILDDIDEIMVLDTNIQIGASEDIQVDPYLIFGKHNKRITGFNVYYSTDGITYYHFDYYRLAKASYDATYFEINDDGKMYLSATSTDLHTDSNAGAALNEADSIGNVTFLKLADESTVISTSGEGETGSYCLKFSHNQYNGIHNGPAIPISSLEPDTEYSIDVYLKSNRATHIFVLFSNIAFPATEGKYIDITNAFVNYTFTLTTPTETNGQLYLWLTVGNAELFIDNLIVKKVQDSEIISSTTLGTEMSAKMGYTPTFNIVKSWDQAIVLNGRVFYLNPYVDKRYDNFIAKSHINSDGAFMFNTATMQEQIEFEKFDNQNSIGMAVIQGPYILVLKNNSWMILDPDTNQFIRDDFGQGCITRRSIVNYGHKVIWCGLEEVYELNTLSGYEAIRLLENSIRDRYIDQIGKNGIVGVRNKYDAYSLRLYDATNKLEFLYTHKGWIERSKSQFAKDYRLGSNGRNWWMNNQGKIYQDKGVVDVPPLDEIIMTDDLIVE